MRRRRGGALRLFFFATGRLVDAVIEYYWSPLPIDVDVFSSCNWNHFFHDLQPSILPDRHLIDRFSKNLPHVQDHRLYPTPCTSQPIKNRTDRDIALRGYA